MNLLRVFVSAAFLNLVLSPLVLSQSPLKSLPKQRISFGMEDESFPNQVPVPETARKLISEDHDVKNVLHYAELTPAELPANWLQCAEVRLSQSGEPDLVVMGVNQLLGANITSFWILRPVGNGYEVALRTAALTLTILPTRTNGLFDLETGASTANRYFLNEYAYMERAYELSKSVSAPIGEEVPTDFSNYTAQKTVRFTYTEPLNPNEAFAHARDWLWTQWRLEKPTYLKLIWFSKEGDETSALYLIDKTVSQGVVVTIVHRRIEFDRTPSHKGRKLERVNIDIAADVERHAVAQGDKLGPELPESSKPPDVPYKLLFTDYFGDTVHTL